MRMAPIKVLLVDDHQFICTVVSRIVSTEPDIELHTCLDAATALARAAEIRPSVIFQDLVMPDADGFTMVRRLRELPALSRTPIIVLSGNDDSDSRKRAAAAGATDYLVKLPTKRDLIDCIRRHAVREDSASGAAHQ